MEPGRGQVRLRDGRRRPLQEHLRVRDEILQYFERMKESYRPSPRNSGSLCASTRRRTAARSRSKRGDSVNTTRPTPSACNPQNSGGEPYFDRVPSDAPAEVTAKARERIEDILKQAVRARISHSSPKSIPMMRAQKIAGAPSAFPRRPWVPPFGERRFRHAGRSDQRSGQDGFGWHLIG